VASIPPGKLILKVRALIILLWNLLPDNGLYNSTRLVVIILGRYIITGKILGGSFDSYIRSVPKIASIIDKKYLGFTFKRF
jgi:hypothetical protein